MKWSIQIDLEQLLNSIRVKSEPLKQKLLKIKENFNTDIQDLNVLLEHNNFELFRKNKAITIRWVSEKELKFTTSQYSQTDRQAVAYFFTQLLLALRQCSPPFKEETDQEKEKSHIKEQTLCQRQREFNQNTDMLNMLKAIKKTKFKQGLRVYLMYAWPEGEYREREQWIQDDFIPLLDQHFKLAGIRLIWDKGTNHAGSNLNQFMANLSNSDYVLLLGTESMRKKLLTNPTAIHFEEKLLGLKRLYDMHQGDINENKTTIIPYVLTGIRQTAFTDEWDNITIRTWRNFDYQMILVDIICQIYEVHRDRLIEFITSSLLSPAAATNPRHDSQEKESNIGSASSVGHKERKLYHSEEAEDESADEIVPASQPASVFQPTISSISRLQKKTEHLQQILHRGINALKPKGDDTLCTELTQFLAKFIESDIIQINSEITALIAEPDNEFIQDSINNSFQQLSRQLLEKYATIEAIKNSKPTAKTCLAILQKLIDFSMEAPTTETKLMKETIYGLLTAELIAMACKINFSSKEICEEETCQPVTCFISYSWGVGKHEALACRLYEDLRKVGINVYMDKHNNGPASSINYFTEEVLEVNYVLLMGSKNLLRKYKEDKAFYKKLEKARALGDSQVIQKLEQEHSGYIVNQELDMILARKSKNPFSILSLLLDGSLTECLPPEFRRTVAITFQDWEDEKRYCEYLFEILEHVLLEHKQLVKSHQEHFIKILNETVELPSAAIVSQARLTIWGKGKGKEKNHPIMEQDTIENTEQNDRTVILTEEKVEQEQELKKLSLGY